MDITDTASSNRPRRRWHWFAQVESLERMDLAELRKQVKQNWIMLGGALLTCLLLFSVYLMPTTSAWHIANSIALAIQTAFVIYNVTGLVKLKGLFRVSRATRVEGADVGRP